MSSKIVRIILPANKNVQVLDPLMQPSSIHPGVCTPGQIRLINSNVSFAIPSVVGTQSQPNTALRVPLSSLTNNQQILQAYPLMTPTSSTLEMSQSSTTTTDVGSSGNNILQYDSAADLGKILI